VFLLGSGREREKKKIKEEEEEEEEKVGQRLKREIAYHAVD